jgi:hypothetical protein
MAKLRLVLMLAITAAAIIALPDVSDAQPNASGGGCAYDSLTGQNSCVAAYGEEMPLTLIGNFSLDHHVNTDPNGYVKYFMCFAGGGCNFHFMLVTYYTGSYPLMYDQTGMGAGSARSEFEMYEFQTFVHYDTRWSPWQYWIP